MKADNEEGRTMQRALEARPAAAAEMSGSVVGVKDALWVSIGLGLGGIQLLQGTDPYFAFLNVLFFILWGACLKACGGVRTLTGAAIGYLGLQHVVISQFAKILFWQRPDTPLLLPILTMEVYVVGIFATLLACLLVRLPCFTKLRPMLPTEVSPDKLRVLAYVTVVLMILRFLGSPQIGAGGIRFLMNFDFLTTLAAASITAYQVTYTQGRKFLHPLSYVCVGLPFLVALIGFQRKEAILSIVIIIVVALAYGFRFKPIHIMTGVALALFFQFIFFPFSLVFRGSKLKSSDPIANFSHAWSTFTDVLANPLEMQKEDKVMPTGYDAQRLLYYDRKPIPTLDRMTTIIITDALLSATETGGTIGWRTIYDGLLMVVPSLFNKEKRIMGTSNWIAHRAKGMLSSDDPGTQITMGYFGEAYMSFKMMGVFAVSFLVAFGALLITRISMGDAFKGNFWICSWIVTIPWNLSEGPVQVNAITFLQTVPLFVAYGLLILVLSNSLSRTPDPDRDSLPEKPTFKEEGLRLAG